MERLTISDPPGPNLFRDIFPYSEPTRIKLGHLQLVPSPARDMFPMSLSNCSTDFTTCPDPRE